MTQPVPDPFKRPLSHEEKLIREHSRALVLHSLVSALAKDCVICQHPGCMRVSSHWVFVVWNSEPRSQAEFIGCEEHANLKENHMGCREVKIERNRTPDRTLQLSAFALGEREDMP